MSDEQVTVHVNGESRRFYLGLRVRHAIGYQQSKLVECHQAMVEDGDGNRVDLDGALYDGERLNVKVKASPNPVIARSVSDDAILC
jgi:hypothetical protein